MKRCPECRRDYHDDSLLYCLEDGAALVQGSVPSPDEPQTAILHETAAPSEARTQAQIHTTETEPQGSWAGLPERQSLSAHNAAKPPEFDKRLLIAPLALAVIVLGGFFAYRYEARDWDFNRIKVDPFVDMLRDDPRFDALVKRLNLPQ